MIEVILAVLISTGSVSTKEAKSLKYNEKEVIKLAQQNDIDVARIVDVEDTGL